MTLKLQARKARMAKWHLSMLNPVGKETIPKPVEKKARSKKAFTNHTVGRACSQNIYEVQTTQYQGNNSIKNGQRTQTLYK